MWKAMVLLLVIACEPPKAARETTAVAGTPETQHADSCRDDIPDCAAVCALRETHRNEFIDFYERRCAAVILGKNPDKVEPRIIAANPTVSASSSSPSPEFPPDVRASLMTTRAPFDPVSVSRTGGSEPPECRAARILRVQKREREADMMDAMCTAKGGDAGT